MRRAVDKTTGWKLSYNAFLSLERCSKDVLQRLPRAQLSLGKKTLHCRCEAILVYPTDRCRAVLVFSDVADEFSLKAINGSEDALRNNVAMNLGEPSLDLIDPLKIARRVMHPNGGVISEKLEDFRCLIRTGVVDHDVDLATFWLTHHDLCEESDKLLPCWASARWSKHLFRLTVQSVIERGSPAGAAWENWEYRV
jgi:hypothetical protein